MWKILAMLAGLALIAVAHASPLSPDEVQARIKAKGTQAVREAYFECGGTSRSMGYASVEKGSDDWLRIAVLLLKDSDGCYTTGLQSSIALAALRNPQGVLRLVDSNPALGADYICLPFMVDETEPGKIREQLALVNRLARVISKVSAAEVQPQKRKCLARIDAMQADLRAQLSGSSLPGAN